MRTSNTTLSPDKLAKNVEIEARAREELAKRTPTFGQSLICALWIAICSAAFSGFQAAWPVKVLLMLPAFSLPAIAFELHNQCKRANAALTLLRLSDGR